MQGGGVCNCIGTHSVYQPRLFSDLWHAIPALGIRRLSDLWHAAATRHFQILSIDSSQAMLLPRRSLRHTYGKQGRRYLREYLSNRRVYGSLALSLMAQALLSC